MKGRRAKSPGAPGQSIFPRDAVPFHPLRPVSSIHSAAPLADADWVHGIKHELHCRNGQAMRVLSFLGGQSSVFVVCAATLKMLKINLFSPGQAAARSRKK
jgi:hypothetical protein